VKEYQLAEGRDDSAQGNASADRQSLSLRPASKVDELSSNYGDPSSHRFNSLGQTLRDLPLCNLNT